MWGKHDHRRETTKPSKCQEQSTIVYIRCAYIFFTMGFSFSLPFLFLPFSSLPFSFLPLSFNLVFLFTLIHHNKMVFFLNLCINNNWQKKKKLKKPLLNLVYTHKLGEYHRYKVFPVIY